MLQTFLASVGGVGGAVAVITLVVNCWPGALERLSTGLYAHVNPARLPYDSDLSRHFAHSRETREAQADLRGRLDELQRDTIKNTIISLIYGDRTVDHSEAVRYEMGKLEKLDARCWVMDAARDYLDGRVHCGKEG